MAEQWTKHGSACMNSQQTQNLCESTPDQSPAREMVSACEFTQVIKQMAGFSCWERERQFSLQCGPQKVNHILVEDHRCKNIWTEQTDIEGAGVEEGSKLESRVCEYGQNMLNEVLN